MRWCAAASANASRLGFASVGVVIAAFIDACCGGRMRNRTVGITLGSVCDGRAFAARLQRRDRGQRVRLFRAEMRQFSLPCSIRGRFAAASRLFGTRRGRGIRA